MVVGLGRVELPTSPLSGVRSSHLSYRPGLEYSQSLETLSRLSFERGEEPMMVVVCREQGCFDYE